MNGTKSEAEVPSEEDLQLNAATAFVRAVVKRLDDEISAARDRAEQHAGAAAVEIVEAFGSLVKRGGKRLRVMLTYAGYICVAQRSPTPLDQTSLEAIGTAWELLQAYLLAHDDWMDNDDMRRGGPSMHIMLRGQATNRDAHLGASLAVLAGDFGSALSSRVLLTMPTTGDIRDRILACFSSAHEDVVFGQALDLVGEAKSLERMYELKTASYTVVSPLLSGAMLAGAREEQLDLLRSLGRNLGLAFQLRDDLLGVFGDPTVTGKPSSSDLRSGKRTAVVVLGESLPGEADRIRFARILAQPRTTVESEIAWARQILKQVGADKVVESRIKVLEEHAEDNLARFPLVGLVQPAIMHTLVNQLLWRQV